jgi:predicted TIM-barrel fold metal-dependent hydrolase
MPEAKETPMAHTYKVISGDSHFESPPESWAHRIPKGYRDQASRRIKLADGRDAIVSENGITYGGTGLVGGKSHEKFNPAVLDYDNTPGSGGPEQRLREQDQDGVDAEIIFGRGGGFRKDKNTHLALIRAFNDYLAEEYCSVDPNRLIALGILPGIGIDLDIAEMAHCAEMGLKGIWVPGFPSGKSFPVLDDDRFWATALDMNMPVVIHTSFQGNVGARNAAHFDYPSSPEGNLKPPVDYIQRMARNGTHHCGALEAVQLAVSGVFERFPKLNVYWAENNVGWLPYFYEQVDREYDTNRHWAENLMGVKPLPHKPSDYLREHAYWGFFDDPIGMRLRHDVGVDHIMWSNDFPHEVSAWPNSMKVLEDQTQGVPEDEMWKMLAGNAIDFFHLDHVPATA